MSPFNQKEEFSFYKNFLRKEMEVIEKNALQLHYTKVSVSPDSNRITFTISLEEGKGSSRNDILKHICDGNSVNSDGCKYLFGGPCQTVAAGQPGFAGHPCKFKNDQFTICDCEGLKGIKLPKQGWLMEDTSIQIQEKKRQLNAIHKIQKMKELNRDLTYYLFHPEELGRKACEMTPKLGRTYQKDANGDLLRYNDNQVKAIFNALELSPVSVIQGPPGTGKTTVITEIVFQILARDPRAKILITSQTNNAVDQVLENLIKNNIQVARLAGITRPKSKIVAKHTMARKLEGWKQEIRKNAIANFTNLDCPSEEESTLHKNWLDAVASLKENGNVKERLLRSIRVIGGTCNHVASSKYLAYDFNFDYVIMDESGKATLAESLVPIVMGKKLIMVGDHRQLRPMLTTQKEVESWLRSTYDQGEHNYESYDEYFNRPSLFELVIERIPDSHKTQLTECRRCPGLTVELTSRSFYEPMGDLPIVSANKSEHAEHNFPFVVDSPLIFLDIHSEYSNKLDKNNSSYNERSAEYIRDLLLKFSQCKNADQHSYGIISGYKAQHTQLTKTIYAKSQELSSLMKGEEKFTVSVIDRFQGLERDVVIVDLVKSGYNAELGFLEIPNRINVALSRQKKLLVIVGDYNGILQAKTHRSNGKPCALQNYLKAIPKDLIFPADRLGLLFK
ncbi:MAG: DNA2/NAM7 family helicase [Bacteroidales bacterium]|nr:DNA2/NAM7 family helicase [Bacteroidales bacterium]